MASGFEYSRGDRVYAGTRLHFKNMGDVIHGRPNSLGVFYVFAFLLDLPLSFCVDTLALPLTLTEGPHTFERERTPTALAFSPEGKLLASGGKDGFIRVWEVPSGTLVWGFRAEKGRINTVAFSPNGQSLVSAGEEGWVNFWNVDTRARVRRFRHGETAVNTVLFLPDGERMLTAGDDQRLRLWDYWKQKELRSLNAFVPSSGKLILLPDEKTVAWRTGSETIQTWDFESGLEPPPIAVDHGYRSALAVSPDGQVFATAKRPSLIDITQADTGDRLLTFDAFRSINHLEFSSDGKVLVGVAGYGLRVWDATDWKELHSLGSHKDYVTVLALSPDGKAVASGAGIRSEKRAEIMLWNVTTGNRIRTIHLR